MKSAKSRRVSVPSFDPSPRHVRPRRPNDVPPKVPILPPNVDKIIAQIGGLPRGEAEARVALKKLFGG